MVASSSDQIFLNKFLSISQVVTQRIGLVLVSLIPFIVIYNEYATLKNLDPYFRITLPALCFAFALLTTSFSLRAGMIGCVFALPLIPNLAIQIHYFLGYARVAHLHNPGLELIAGLYCGAILHYLAHRRNNKFPLVLPWQASLVMIFLTISVVLSIAKNLYQTGSEFHFSALIYSFLNMRTIGWHDDYQPLTDWIAYGSAFVLLAIFAPALKALSDRNHIVFKPLIWGVTIAAIVGYWQSTIGIGLNKDQLMFRADFLGYMAVGFQPDNHAFAAHMLLGTIGLIGYLYYTDSKLYRFWIVALAMPLAWVSLLLSKSRASLGLSIVFLIVIFLIWVFRRSQYLGKTARGLLIFVSLGLVSFVLFKDIWLSYLTILAHKLGYASLGALNLALVYRPEIFAAAIKIFSLFPIFGIGQSEFYRQAASHELTNSYYLSIEQNGENAHNYFLQTLAETGIVGFALFTLFVLYPLWKIKDKQSLIPALVGLSSIFLSNLYAHSLLIRENLFLVTVMIALMYAWLFAEKTPATVNSKTVNFLTFNRPIQVMAGLALTTLLFLGAREIYLSFNRFPFTEDIQCFKNKSMTPDGWTSGQLIIDLPSEATGVSFSVIQTHPGIDKRPLTGSVKLVGKDNVTVISKDLLFNKEGPSSFELSLPNSVIPKSTDYRVELNLDRCFIPKNFGNTPDGRRLGIRLEPIIFK